MPRVGRVKRNCKHHGLTDFYIYVSGGKECISCNSERKRAAHKERRAKAYEYLGGKCKICGYDKCLDALDFHHLNPKEKEGLVRLTLSWETIKKELDKCVLLCATCHRETHAGLHPEYLIDA